VKEDLKAQKAAIDKIKQIIKAPPKKFTASHKFYCLKLLNKIVMKKNPEVNKYVDKKLLKRLCVFAEFNN
jgi:hypothetical protein